PYGDSLRGSLRSGLGVYVSELVHAPSAVAPFLRPCARALRHRPACAAPAQGRDRSRRPRSPWRYAQPSPSLLAQSSSELISRCVLSAAVRACRASISIWAFFSPCFSCLVLRSSALIAASFFTA